MRAGPGHSAQWGAIERRKGDYDFSRHEAIYNEAAARGAGIVFILAYNNQLHEPTGQRGIHTDEGRAAFAAFAAAFVGHFRGKNIVWEIWNEPNTKNFWGGQPNSQEIADDYVKLVQATAPAMRKADPQCIIVAGSVSNLWSKSYEWMERALERGVLQSGIDGWSVHPYGLKKPEDCIEAYETVRRLMREHGGVTDLPPLLNTERGFPLNENEAPDAVEATLKEQEASQASNLVRQYLVDLLCDVRLTVWYAWRDQEFGVVDGRRERAACRAAQVLSQQLSGFRFERRLATASPDDYVLLFQSGDEAKLAAWTTGAPHKASIAVAESTGSVESTSMLGEGRKCDIANGRLELELDNSPHYVEFDEVSALADERVSPSAREAAFSPGR